MPHLAPDQPPTTIRSRSDKWRQALLLLAFVAVFSIGAWGRFSLPMPAFFTPDSLGYAGPGLDHVVKGEMTQTHQRSFFYPLLLRGVMVFGSDLHQLTTFQHLAGLLSGILWWVVWLSWCQRLTGNKFLREWGAPVIGLILLAVYLWSANTILLEHSIRPEAIFPLFALAQIACSTACFFAATRTPLRFPNIFFSASGAVFFGMAATGLKPSWLLAWTGVAFLLFLVLRSYGFLKKQTAWVASGLLAGLLFWFASIGFCQNLLAWRKDDRPSDFLVKTLVTVHAPQIVEFWNTPAQQQTLSAEDWEFLARLQASIEESKREKHHYETLGFDPDFIFYRSKVLDSTPVPDTERLGYLKNYYMGALLGNPSLFLPKISQQFLNAYFPSSDVFHRDSLRLRTTYFRSQEALQYLWETNPAPPFAPWLPYLAATQKVTETAPQKFAVSPAFNGTMIHSIRYFLLPSLLFGLGSAAFLLWTPHTKLSLLIEPAFWSIFSFGAVATVAIVHSFDISRYQHNLVFLHTLVAGYGIVLLLLALTQNIKKLPSFRTLGSFKKNGN